MAQVIYQGFYDDLEAGNVTDNVDIRAHLLMSNTTTDVEPDAQNVSDFTTYDEADGVGYVALDLANVTVTYDDSNDRLVIDADDGDFEAGLGSIGVCSRNITRVAITRYVDGTAANDVPWGSIDIGPYVPAGGAFDVTWNSTGILHIGSA